MATPEIRLNAGGVEMSLNQEALIGTSASLSSDGKHLLTIGSEDIAKLSGFVKGRTRIGKFKPSRMALWSLHLTGNMLSSAANASRFGMCFQVRN